MDQRDHSGCVLVAAYVIVLLVLGSCTATTVACWHRGGTVIKNVFDWPTCVAVTRK